MKTRVIYLSIALALLAATAPAQWDIQNSHTTASLRGIDNVGKGVAWTSGTDGTVLRTEDGGYVWQLCAIPPGAEKLDFRGVQAFDANTAIVMSSGKGDLSRLYKTTDGCQTWKLIFTNPDKDGFWDAVKFTDRATRGYLLGDPVNDSFRLWRSEDKGDTWLEYQTRTFHADPRAQGAFAASNSALWAVVGQNPFLAWASGGTAGAMVYSWAIFPAATGGAGGGSRREVPIGHKSQSSGIFSLWFRYAPDSFPIAVAVGGDYMKPDDNSATAAETQDGANWRAAQTPPHGFRSAVAYDADQKLWITVGPNGTDISTDDGRNWSALKPSSADPPDADKNWNALSLPYVVGPNGHIGKLRTISVNNPAVRK